MTNPRKDAEKALSEIEALLGETTEGAAALHVLRDLTETAAPGDAAYCLTRIALAIEVAQKRAEIRGYDRGYEMACQADGSDVDEGDEDGGDMDGNHETALASVYGEND